MRKTLLIVLFSLLAVSSFASDVLKYRANSYAYKYKTERGYWTDWSDWKNSTVLIVINLDRDKIDIYSDTPQHYDIYDSGNNWVPDSGGGEQLTLNCVDDNGLRCDVRLRKQGDGQLQLYVEFNDAMWVYTLD